MRELNGATYARMLRGGAARLNENRKLVNDLNVFPVPDGDTGDNMYMTFIAGVKAVNDNDNLADTAKKASVGMLYGARGNSGVILSRIFAGFAAGFENSKDIHREDIIKASSEAVAQSYDAVSNPAEGTILTVFRDATEYANSKLVSGSTVESYLDDFIEAANKSLENTPELLPVLKKAGVVDSGGAGVLYIAEGMRAALDDAIDFAEAETVQNAAPDFSLFTESSEMHYGYCTEFLLRLQKSKVDLETFDETVIKDFLEGIGDSVVTFREGSIVKAHVHTLTPGNVLNFCQKYGEFLTLKIENMTLQHNGNKAEEQRQMSKKKYGAVAVACGEGVKDMFSELGTDVVVDGGQSCNPSTEDFIEAYKKVRAENIFVLPNNSNVILAAKQSAKLYTDSNVIVIETKSIGEGYSAISAIDLSLDDVEEIAAGAKEAAEYVVTASVSKACRDTEEDEVFVKNGDYIGFSGKTVYSDSADKNTAAAELLKKLPQSDVLLILCGEDTTDEEADNLVKALQPEMKRTEIVKLNGGQPIYDYMFILE